MSVRILVVDDEPTIRAVIAQVLGEEGYDIHEANSAEEALEAFRKSAFPVVITDIIMRKMSGLDLLREVRLLEPETLVIVMTSQASLDTATRALRNGAFDYLTKPFEDISLIAAVARKAIDKLGDVQEKQQMVHRLKQSAEELQTLNIQLREMADRDGLTGLFNHRHFRACLEAEIGHSMRHGRSFSLLFLDVDHFKRFNDTNGHLQGDQVLKGLARIIREQSRAATVAARYGGEEFVLIARDTPKEGARAYAEHLRRLVEVHPFEGRESQPGGAVTLSLGVSTFPEDGTDAVSLIAAADRALYRAKHGGRNQVRCAEPVPAETATRS
jgi:diguanylate cyclase (GGDEF)-like protein